MIFGGGGGRLFVGGCVHALLLGCELHVLPNVFADVSHSVSQSVSLQHCAHDCIMAPRADTAELCSMSCGAGSSGQLTFSHHAYTQ